MRGGAPDVEQTTDDPPERISAWLATVATGCGRSMTLVHDAHEEDDEKGSLTSPWSP
jgi:hypothetical protein